MESSNPKTIFESEDAFEINDFTVVTEFEVFVLSLENAIQELNVDANNFDEETTKLSDKLGALAETTLEYENFQFQLDYFRQGQTGLDSEQEKMDIGEREEDAATPNYLCKAAINLANHESDFLEDSIIAKQYGIPTDFILICPVGKNNYFTESKVNMIMSAVNVATANIECQLPIFLQFTKGASVGVMQNRNCFTNFEGVVFDKCLNKHRYLDGVIDMFKQKVNEPLGCDTKIKVSLQWDFQKCLNVQKILDTSTFPSESDSNEKAKAKCAHKYPFQLVDCLLLKELWISAIWVDVPEHYLTENETYTNIDAQNAHRWKLAVKFDNEFSYELSFLFSRLLEHREEEYSKRSVKNLIPTSSTESGGSLAANALGPLLNKPAINFELVQKFDIFADEDCSHENISTCLSNIIENKTEYNIAEIIAEDDYSDDQERLWAKLSLAKSAPTNCFTTRLVTCLMSRLDQNLIGFCRLWMKFVDILRHHWEYNLYLPFEWEDGRPDLSNCLLQQKLEMIQYCILMKNIKYNEMDMERKGWKNDMDTKGWKNADTSLNEDDEFYDAIEQFDDTADGLPSTSSKPLEAPIGRFHPLEPAKFLKKYPSERIYVPLTQESAPMTEDQLDKHESYLVSLEDTNLRTKAQSNLLLSDMQAFKAANPGCVLEDFLCWHSPRDLVEGEISERMRMPGNFWQENWEEARPLAASKQNRLFNETKEVEQILQFFTNLKLRELIDLILPIVSVQMTKILIENCQYGRYSSTCMEPVKLKLEKLIGQVQYGTKTMDDMDAFYDIAASLRSVEEFLMKYSSVANLFAEPLVRDGIPLEPSMADFVTSLCNANFDSVDELSLKSVQLNVPVPAQMTEFLKTFMENEEEADLEATEEDLALKPKRKQIILRRTVPSPGPGSRPMPQRMFTSYRDGEFILCGAFTSDVTFM